jgi:hypothetical protein
MSFGELTRRFLRDEANGYVRERLLAVVDHRASGVEHLTFNVFNVNMDFDSGTVTIEDELDADVEESVPMREFLAALRPGPA